MAVHLHSVGLNWDVYESVTKDGVIEACENTSTSAGVNSDSESEGASSAESARAHGQSSNTSYSLAVMALLRSLHHAQVLAHAPPQAQEWGGWTVQPQHWGPTPPAPRLTMRQKKRQRVLRRLAAYRIKATAATPSATAPAVTELPPLLLPDSPWFSTIASGSDLPHDYPPPPGLVLAPPPGLPAPPVTADMVPVEQFNVKKFRRVLVATLRELAVGGSVPRAVLRIRLEAVPREHQASEFADILTRAAEEQFGSSRRVWWAFAAGLCVGVDAPGGRCFAMTECTAGLEMFFRDIYPSLCLEVYKLQAVTKGGLVPTLQSVFPAHVLRAALPADLLSP